MASVTEELSPAAGGRGGDDVARVDIRAYGPIGAAERAFERLGVYKDSRKAWQIVTAALLEEGRLSSLSVEDVRRLVTLLAEKAEVTQGSFWDSFSTSIQGVLADSTIEDLVELCRLYARIRCYNEIIFGATTRVLMQQWAVYSMEPDQLVQLLTVMSQAGSANERVSRMATLIFNQGHERLVEDIEEFEAEPLIAVIESMARFQVKPQVAAPVLLQIGRAKLHASLMDLPAEQIAKVCVAYGELGYRHDTVFKNVIEAIIREHEGTQRARALGTMGSDAVTSRDIMYDEHGNMVTIKFSVNEIALIAHATLQLKMHRGNTSWCKWADNYEELMDILERRVEDNAARMPAKALAAAAFVLGRAKYGTEPLYKAMFDRMMELLAAGHDFSSADDPPQYELARFMDGLVMMGPTRKKELDGQWLMQWICAHFMMFNLGDLVRVNRHLVSLGIHEQDYLKIFVDPFLLERVDELTKEEIMEVTHTYNHARISEEEVGRHLFWAMGLRFQKLHAAARGQKMRPDYRRVG